MATIEEHLGWPKNFGFYSDLPWNFRGGSNTAIASKTIGKVGMAADYLCDGIADQVEFQAAIDAVAATGGGDVLVRFSPTRYNVSSPFNPKSNVRLIGEEGAAIEKTGTGYIIQGETYDFHDFTVENITFYGKVNQTVSAPTTGRTTSGAGTTTAIQITGNLDPNAVSPGAVSNITIRYCKFRNIASLPVRIFGIDGVNYAYGNQFYNCKDPGWGFSHSLQVIKNYSYMSADNGMSLSRGNRKVVCENNTVELSAFSGIWLSGFFGDLGPEEFSCTGNVVRNVGESCIMLRDAPMYGTITGNTLNQGYNRGPVGAPNDEDCCGIFIAGYPYGITSAPVEYATGLNVTGNTIRNAARAGIYYNAVKGLKLSDNLILDTGTQYLADGTTAVQSTNDEQNIGIFCDVGTTISDVMVTDNQIYDFRGTPFTNWAIQPITQTGAIIHSNAYSGMRNLTNKATLADDVGTGVNPSYTAAGLDSSIGFSFTLKGNGRFTTRSASGATVISNMNLHNTGTGTGAGVGMVLSAGSESTFIGGYAASRLDASTSTRLSFRVLSNSALTGTDATAPLYIEGTPGSPFLGLNAGQKVKRTAVSDTAYTALVSDYIIAYTALTASRTVTLPTSVGKTGQVYVLKDEANAAATFNIVVDGNASETIDGSTTATISTNRGVLRIYSDGTNWFTW